jgi:hypothetical protein
LFLSPALSCICGGLPVVESAASVLHSAVWGGNRSRRHLAPLSALGAEPDAPVPAASRILPDSGGCNGCKGPRDSSSKHIEYVVRTRSSREMPTHPVGPDRIWHFRARCIRCVGLLFRFLRRTVGASSAVWPDGHSRPAQSCGVYRSLGTRYLRPHIYL